MSQSLGTLLARLGADTTQFDAALTKSQARMATVGKSMKKIGMKMSMALTLPLALIGGASFKMAKDFEVSMSKVIGLVGVAKEQVNAWKEDILAMAPAVGKMPKELGEALFFVTSAGIRGAKAMEVLEASAKAASAGLGETKDVADLVTSAMNAYGSETLSAMDATNVLVAAVREGKAEAADLAGSMGMVLPIASEMGVRFDEVGAAIAAMTRTGTNAATASMQLRQILASLIKPTEQAKESLKNMGTSASEMRKILREDGLVVALTKLKKITSEYGEEAMSTVFPNIRALSGVLDLMGSNAKDNIAIFDRMTDSTGSLDKAFEAASSTTQFKWNKSMSKMNVTLIKLGNVVKEMVMPILSKLFNFIGKIGDAFNSLSKPMKKIVIGISGILAAVGPLLIVLGFIISSIIPALVTGFMAVRTAFIALNAVIMANPYAALLTVIALVVTAMITFGRKTKEVSKFHSEYYGMLAKEKSGLDLLFSSLNNAAKGTRERKIALDQINKIYGKYLPDLLTEKSNTEDLAKAYDLINKALIQNITLKARQADIAKITNESIEVQKTIVSEVTIGGGAEAALTLGRIRDNIDKIKEKKIAIPMFADIDYGTALKVFDDLQEETVNIFEIMAAGGKIPYPDSDEMIATVKLLQLQNQEQEKLNDIYAFYSLLLKDAEDGLTKVNTQTVDIVGNFQKAVGKFGAPGEKLNLVLKYMGLEFMNLSKTGSKAMSDLTDLVLPNIQKIKKMIAETTQAMKDSIPTILQYRNAFANFDVMEGVFDGMAETANTQIENLKQAIKSGLQSLTNTFAEGLGNLMTGDASFKDFGNSILSGIGSFLKQMGGALIVFAGIMEAFKDWAIANPVAAIVLGIAAIAAGTALMNVANKGPDMGGVQGLATGGVVTSGGIFEVGEKGSEMVSLPKGSAVTPHGGGMMQELYAKISGEDIYLSNKRYGSKLGKVT